MHRQNTERDMHFLPKQKRSYLGFGLRAHIQRRGARAREGSSGSKGNCGSGKEKGSGELHVDRCCVPGECWFVVDRGSYRCCRCFDRESFVLLAVVRHTHHAKRVTYTYLRLDGLQAPTWPGDVLMGQEERGRGDLRLREGQIGGPLATIVSPRLSDDPSHKFFNLLLEIDNTGRL